jgi:uncharacterized protein RhaS with RHS repeats
VNARWISQDPLGFDAGDSNLYRYSKNSPTLASDPSGFTTTVSRATFRDLLDELSPIQQGVWEVKFKSTLDVDVKDKKVQGLSDKTYIEKLPSGKISSSGAFFTKFTSDKCKTESFVQIYTQEDFTYDAMGKESAEIKEQRIESLKNNNGVSVVDLHLLSRPSGGQGADPTKISKFKTEYFFGVAPGKINGKDPGGTVSPRLGKLADVSWDDAEAFYGLRFTFDLSKEPYTATWDFRMLKGKKEDFFT